MYIDMVYICTSVFSLVDGIKLWIDVVVQVEPGHSDELVDGFLQVDLLWHLGCRGDMEDGEAGVDGTGDSVFG